VSRENRRFISSSIPGLIALYFEKYRINEILKFYNKKMGEDFKLIHSAVVEGTLDRASFVDLNEKYLEGFEKTRRVNVTLPNRTLESVITTANEGIKELAKVEPHAALKASRIVNEFLLFGEIELPEKDTNLTAYLDNWETILFVYRRDLKDLRKIIFWLTIKVNIIQCVKLNIYLYQQIKLVNDSTENINEFLELLKPNKKINKDT
jgi:hypothetical protein